MKVKLKLKLRHPNNAMALGRHVVTHVEQTFELNEKESKELLGAGPQHWFSISEVKVVKRVTKKTSKLK